MDIPSPQQLLDFTGKSVLVTGGGAGIGTGIALRFAAAGADLIVNYRSSEQGATAVVKQIAALGRRALAVQADVAQNGGANLVVERAMAEFGRLDVLINNAGSYPLASLVEMSAEEWDRAFADNLRSAHLATQAAARVMRDQPGGGSIVNISSIEAANPAPRHAHYSAAKAGLLMYTRAAAQELGPYGIRVNSVSPGLIWREGLDEAWPEGVSAYQTAVPLQRLGRFEDVADACLFFASPMARWITGANLVVDGGVMTHRIY